LCTDIYSQWYFLSDMHTAIQLEHMKAYVGVYGRKTLEHLKETGYESVNYINMGQDKGQ